MSDFLANMATASRLRADRLSANEMERAARLAAPPIPLTLDERGFDLVAEVKLRSPAEGAFETGSDEVAERADVYASSGAAAVSVLTEPDRFDGSLDHLQEGANSVSVPVMRKDFLVDPLQVLEARSRGASGVLLITKILDAERLATMTDAALGLGMFVLVELFDHHDIEAASHVFDREILLGVNCRDLTTLEVRFERLNEMVGQLPYSMPLVAESGVTEVDDARSVAEMGYRLALVGSALMRSSRPGDLVRGMIEAGRSVTAGAST